MHEQLFRNQAELEVEALVRYAQALELMAGFTATPSHRPKRSLSRYPHPCPNLSRNPIDMNTKRRIIGPNTCKEGNS
jgi:hypothetical protein